MKESAPSSRCRWRIRPKRVSVVKLVMGSALLTKNDFATVEDADQFIPWSFVVVDLEKFYHFR